MHLRTGLWVKAYLRILDRFNIPAFVIARGDPDLGSVMVKVTDRDGNARIMQRGYDMSADRDRWMVVNEGEDSEVDVILGRHRQRDADMWILEIESPDGEHHLAD